MRLSIANARLGRSPAPGSLTRRSATTIDRFTAIKLLETDTQVGDDGRHVVLRTMPAAAAAVVEAWDRPGGRRAAAMMKERSVLAQTPAPHVP